MNLLQKTAFSQGVEHELEELSNTRIIFSDNCLETPTAGPGAATELVHAMKRVP